MVELLALPTVVKSEAVFPGEHVVSEAANLSRDLGVIAAGATARYRPGTVLGRVTATGKLTQLAPLATDGTANTDGSQVADSILYSAVDATIQDKPGVITARMAEVNGLLLTWPTGITVQQQTIAITQLVARGIQVRT